jgi:hypothetical protein
MARLLDVVDEERLLRLAATQPESGPHLAGYLDRLKERATELVLADERMREKLGRDRWRVLTADYREDKAPEGEPVGRLGEIGVYDYDRDVLVAGVVDLRTGEVTEIVEREGAAPPITPEELGEALRIADAVANVQRIAGLPETQVVAFPTPSYAFERRRGSERHRGCTVYVQAPDGETARAVVDLSAAMVVPDEELPDILRSGGQGRA